MGPGRETARRRGREQRGAEVEVEGGRRGGQRRQRVEGWGKGGARGGDGT